MEIPELPDNIKPRIFETFMYALIEVTDTQVLYRGKPITDKNKKILSLDAPSFTSLSLGYFKDKNGVYGMTHIVKSHSEKFYLTLIPNVDVTSFKAINKDYAKDKNNTYFADHGKVIKGTDFIPLKKFIKDGKTEITELTKDFIYRADVVLNASHVYYRGRLLKNADPATFCQLGSYWYKDMYSVYFVDAYHITKHTAFDPSTFIALNYNGTDKNMPSALAFYNCTPEYLVNYGVFKDFFEANTHLKDYWYFAAKEKLAQQKTKEPVALGEGFFSIANEIYYQDRKKDENLTRILNATLDNFKFLKDGYATNGNDLILIKEEYESHWKKLRQIQVSTKQPLEVLSDAWVYDGINFYHKATKKFKADYKTFVVLNAYYAYDKDDLFYEGVRKKDIKLSKNITVLGGVYIKIDDTIYYRAKVKKTSNFDDSKVKLLTDYSIMGANGAGFMNGKYRKYFGDFDKFSQLKNGNWGDGTLEWRNTSWGLELA